MAGRVKVRWTIAAILGALVVFGGFFIYPKGKPSSLSANPECPHDWGKMITYSPKPGSTAIRQEDLDLARSTGRPVVGVEITEAIVDNPDLPPEGFAVPGETTNVPEFHDCQKLRLVDANGNATFGDLAAIFAKEALDSVTVDSLTNGVVLGFVYLPFGGSYPTLHIQGKFSCLVVKQTDAALEAWMVNVVKEDDCDRPASALATSDINKLAVRVPALDASFVPDHVPAVARWDWDDATSKHFIGIRCANAWCEIGAEGFGPSLSYVYASLPTAAAQRNLAVKGWYDEQFLAEYPAGVEQASANRGSVVPTAALEAFKQGAVAVGSWGEVATIHTRASAGSYKGSFHFVDAAADPPDGEHVTLSLCRGSWLSCKPSTFRRFWPTSCDLDRTETRWYARVTRANGSSKFYCTLFREHKHDGGKAFDIPAVTRWRWRRNDETIWVSCPQGCCEVNADT